MGILDTVKIMIGMAAPNSDGAFTAPAAAMPRDLEAQHHQALAEAAREALRTAHVERASAAAALDAAEAKVARALEVIATSQRLDSEAGAAEAAAREAARIWTAAGCPEDSRPDASLLDAAAAASNAAVDARTVAAGAHSVARPVRLSGQIFFRRDPVLLPERFARRPGKINSEAGAQGLSHHRLSRLGAGGCHVVEGWQAFAPGGEYLARHDRS